ncbi:histidine--tRNA ligase [Marinilabilia salmonicolor]|jgi:histidyl-tRNA synthetase|uniref:Histidine--tRNA ligase n=1 Tax=Marinilabilia salmonicolor TaxID=989 RepID=A0A2T0XTL2_9BACT|nr:histidine--tRNA ligase [Marinilabilia salmonicolor]PRZ02258.1 histidyl-tRNA synthetase [Marinilabilia salmonicolor]RCW30643.1 histidyl-tRNA synthetase [Marinilabilia salmonicolor]
MAQKPSIPKGTRDFTPDEMVRRNYIFDSIKEVFQRYGYMPIETPAMENLDTLLGKYGDEGDKLLFKILNSGDFLNKADDGLLAQKDSNRVTGQISEKGLRYDLTVPFARFVVQHQNELSFPFKRYQIQPVWRADRPQKGRYREFFQCDVDVIGSDSLFNEVELIQIVDEVFQKLGIRVVIKLNNRKVLAGIAEIIGEASRLTDITVAIDKLEKIGLEKVNAELSEKGLTDYAIAKLQPILSLSGSNSGKLDQLANILVSSEVGTKGVEELREVLTLVDSLDVETGVEMDLTLARGLNYYTGAIFEVKALDMQIGSITGGGRYDDLTGIFGLKNVSGVGISFGADRIFDVMNQLELYPPEVTTTTQLMFVNFGHKEGAHCLKIAAQLRNEGLKVEVYPDSAKMKKQMTYANKKNIAFVALVGEEEMNAGTVTLKNMGTGEQNSVKVEDIIGTFSE